jgi:hypothetical protein
MDVPADAVQVALGGRSSAASSAGPRSVRELVVRGGGEDPSGTSTSIMGMEAPGCLGDDAPAPRCRGVVYSSPLDYRDTLSFSTILLAAAPEELFC